MKGRRFPTLPLVYPVLDNSSGLSPSLVETPSRPEPSYLTSNPNIYTDKGRDATLDIYLSSTEYRRELGNTELLRTEVHVRLFTFLFFYLRTFQD